MSSPPSAPRAGAAGGARSPQQRDRDARIVSAVARACGFDQPVAPLILRRVPDVERLLDRDDATLRRVLGDDRLREALCAGLRASFRDVWRQATLERMRLDHPRWLVAWWLPVCTSLELDALVAAPAPRVTHRRIGLRRAAFPATAAAAELLLPAQQRREETGYLVVEPRVAVAVRELALEVSRDEGRDPVPTKAPSGLDTAPEGADPRALAGVGWWHGPA